MTRIYICIRVRVQSAGHAIGISKALSRHQTAPKTRRNWRNIRLRRGRSIRAHRYARQGVRFHGSSIRPGAWGRHLFGPSKGLIIILSQITGKSCDEFTTIRDFGYSRPVAAAFSQELQTLMRVVDQYNDRSASTYLFFLFSARPSPLCLLVFSEAQTSRR